MLEWRIEQSSAFYQLRFRGANTSIKKEDNLYFFNENYCAIFKFLNVYFNNKLIIN